MLQPDIDRQFDTNTLNALEYLVIELHETKAIRTVSLICGSTGNCDGMTVRVADFADLAPDWDPAEGQICDATFAAREFGAEF